MDKTEKETMTLVASNDDFFLDSLMAVLDGMRRNDILVDMTLKCADGVELPAHRLVISVVSPHFQRILSHETSSKITIVLPSFITSSCMNILLDFIYSGQLNLPKDANEVKEIINAAHSLELQDFDEYLTAAVVNCLTFDNFRDYWDLAEEMKNAELEKAIRSFLCKDITCLTHHSDFCQLSLERLKKLLFENDESTVSPGVVFSTIMAWVHTSCSESRIDEFENELLPKLNLSCLSKDHLQQVLREEPLVCKSSELWLAIARALYDKGVTVQGYKGHEEEADIAMAIEILKKTEAPPKALRSACSEWSRSPPGDLRWLAGSASSDNYQEENKYRSMMRHTAKRKSHSKTTAPFDYDGSPEHEPVILIMGRKRNGEAAIQCFRLRGNIWTAAAEIEDCLMENAAWATHGNNVYLAGGMDARHHVLDTVYSYNIRTKHFSKMAHMHIARHASRAAVVGWHMYVVGGLGNHERSLSHVERYDVFSDEWENIEPLPYEAWEVGVAASERLLIVVGGRIQREAKSHQSSTERLPMIHSYDPEVNQWTALGTIPDDFNSSYPVTAYTDKTIYMIRHYNPSTMWAFDLTSKKWLRSYDKSIPGPRRVMTMLHYNRKLWIIYYGGKIVIYNLATQSWDREAPFSRTIAIPMYASILNYPVEDQKALKNIPSTSEIPETQSR